MIYLTTAINDALLEPLFGGLAISAPIPHGDFAFFGVWEDNRPIRVCGERKKIDDLVGCINDTGRYMNQLRTAREAGFEFLFMVLEAHMRPGADGVLMVPKGRDWSPHRSYIEYKRVDTYLDELWYYAGVVVKRSHTAKETVDQVVDLYKLFQAPPEEHSSLKQFYTPQLPVLDLWERPNLVRRVAKELKGIGWERSKAVAKRFGSVLEMCEAGEKEWAEIEGIGDKTAKSAVNELRKEG